jgi:hypothetical protein
MITHRHLQGRKRDLTVEPRCCWNADMVEFQSTPSRLL